MPKWNPISISGYHIREAGSTAAQEIGFTLADGVAYVEAALKAGLEVDEFARPAVASSSTCTTTSSKRSPSSAPRGGCGRALMKERFKAKDPRSMMLRFHAQTAGCTLTAQQPLNNVVRVSLQAMAAVLGGCQSLHTNSWDEALALPSEDAARLALRTQQIIAYETGVADTVDPLGGSYHLERLTDELEAKASAYLKRIDELGGMVRGHRAGLPPAGDSGRGLRQAQRAHRDRRQEVVVGVNRFTSEEAARGAAARRRAGREGASQGAAGAARAPATTAGREGGGGGRSAPPSRRART